MHILDEKPGRTAMVNGKGYLLFSGYSYLGMQHVPEFIALVKEGIDKYGWIFPSSRISNTRLKLYEECEALLCSITGKAGTVIVSSGFTAGRMATEKCKDKLINIEPSHPAIQGNMQKIITQGKIFAVDSVDIFNAAITDFSFTGKSNQKKIIIVDDSHGIGVIGKNGEGIASALPQKEITEYIITYSLSKAFNITAGAISCSKPFANELRSMPAYTAGTAPSPALLYAFIKGAGLYAHQREKLKSNMHYFQSLISHIDSIIFHKQLPVFILPEMTDEKALFKKNIVISSFAYPYASGKKIKRVIINALHTKNDLELLAQVLTETFQQKT